MKLDFTGGDHAKCGSVAAAAARLAAEVILQPTELFANEINAPLMKLGRVGRLQRARPK